MVQLAMLDSVGFRRILFLGRRQGQEESSARKVGPTDEKEEKHG